MAKITATMASKSSYGRTRKKPGRYNVDENEVELIAKCKNENCTEQGNHGYFRLCTRCSFYYCCHCCSLDIAIVKLLNDGSDNFWFCPDCAKAALNAIFVDNNIEERCQMYMASIESRLIKIENDKILLVALDNKVSAVIFDS